MSDSGGLEPIKRVVMHRITREFYVGEGKWTPNFQQARDFENLLPVLEEVRKYDLKGHCELVLKFSATEYDVHLPL